MRRDGLVDTCGLTFEVQIERTHDAAVVIRFRCVQPHEVSAIQRHDGSLIGRSQFKNGPVGKPLACPAGVDEGDDVVPHPAQRLDDREWEVLVGEEARHGRLRAFVVADLSFDLVQVSAHVCPGAGQIFRPQPGIKAQ